MLGLLSLRYWWLYEGQEIDLVEEKDGKLYGIECKWSVKKRITPPKDWLISYPKASFVTITPNNYLDFVA